MRLALKAQHLAKYCPASERVLFVDGQVLHYDNELLVPYTPRPMISYEQTMKGKATAHLMLLSSV